MRRVYMILLTVALLLGISFQVLAERRVYAIYEHEGGEDASGPVIGYEWDIDPVWIMAFEYQFPGSGANDASIAAEITRRIFFGVTGAFKAEFGDSLNTYRFKFKGEHDYNLPLQFRESLMYTMNHPDYADSDYNELELSFGVSKKLTPQYKVSLDTTWTQVRYSAARSSLNYEKWDITPKVKYAVNKQLQLSAGYSWNNSTRTAVETKDCFVIGAEYLLENISFYIDCKLPATGNTSSIGVSYKF